MSSPDESQQPSIVDELRESSEKRGFLNPIIETQFGTAAGNNRKKANPDWTKNTLHVKDYLEHLQIEVADNIHEQKPAEWWTDKLTKGAEFLEKERGVPRGQITTKLAEEFGLSKWRVWRYLPQEYKEPAKVKSGAAGGEAKSASSVQAENPIFGPRELKIFAKHLLKPKNTARGIVWDYGNMSIPQSSIGKIADYQLALKEIAKTPAAPITAEESKPTEDKDEEDIAAPTARKAYTGNSARKSELEHKADTPAEQSLQHLLSSIPGLKFDFNQRIKIDEDTTYLLDSLIEKWLDIEVEGLDSASRDNPERDENLRKQGIYVLHVANQVIENRNMRDVLIQCIQLAVLLKRERAEVAAR